MSNYIGMFCSGMLANFSPECSILIVKNLPTSAIGGNWLMIVRHRLLTGGSKRILFFRIL
jgi:hypothetical protein